MAKFIELHGVKNRVLFVNTEEITLISNSSNCNYSDTHVLMRDGADFEVQETKEEIRDLLISTN